MNDSNDRKLEDLLNYFEKLHERSLSYTNLVIGAGYAGYFALWSLARDYILPPLARISLFAMSVSLAIFVLFEIAKMMSISRSIMAVTRLGEARHSSSAERESIIASVLTAHAIEAQRFLRYWARTIGPCIIFGVVGALILMGALLVGV